MALDLERQLRLLKSLHDFDFAIQRVDNGLQAIPQRKAEVQAEYLTAKAALDAKQQEKDEAEKAKRFEEIELAADVERMREREAKLYAIKTNKEYQSALKEIADGKKANREREDRLLKLMEIVESATKEITQLSTQVADTESRCREGVQAIEREVTEWTAERAAAAEKRGQVVKEVNVDIVRVYEHVRQKYPEAVALVERGVCQACHMRIPPQQFLELQQWARLSQCPSCFRILCPSDDLPPEADAPSGEGTAGKMLSSQ